MLWCKLIIDDQMCGKYVGGSDKLDKVHKQMNLEQLKGPNYKATQIKSKDLDIDLLYSWLTILDQKQLKLLMMTMN